MSEDRDRLYLIHIAECIHRIEQDTSGGRDAFGANRTLQDAVLRNLQILCESTQRLSAERKTQRPEIDWRNIGAFRNRMVHDYFNIDLAIVWRIIENDIPALKAVVSQLLSALGTDEIGELPPPPAS